MLIESKAGTRPALSLRLGREALPAVALGVGTFAVALFAVLTALKVTAVGLDENVYKFAAVRHVDDLPFGVLHEGTSRGAARLYSFLISPLFAMFEGDVAVRLARALNGVLFALTAIPVALLARRVTTSPWSPVAAGLLTVAVPWLTLTTVMFTESLSYLLFACALLAMVRALEKPSPGRELLVIAIIGVLVFTRVQFLVLGPAWALALLVLGGRPRRFPVTFALVGIGIVILIVAALVGRFRTFAGPYYVIVERDTIPGDFGTALLWEVAMLSLGVGLLPALLAVPWLWRAVSGREGEPSRWVATVGAVAIGVLFIATLWAQGGFLGGNSEERYFVYAIPLVWLAAVAAVERRELPAGAFAGAAVALAAVLTLVPNPVGLVGEQAYLGPVSLTVAHAMPQIREDVNSFIGLGDALSGGDVLGIVCILLAAGMLVALKRGARARWLALIPAIALQLFFAGYAFSAIYDKVGGVGGTVLGHSFQDLGWIDRATGGNDHVTLLDNQTDPGREGGQRNTVFWNDEVTHVFALSPSGIGSSGWPVSTLPTTRADIIEGAKASHPVPWQTVVSSVDSPLWQLEGSPVRTSPDGRLEIVRVERLPLLKWAAFGLDADGQMARPLTLTAAGGTRVTLDLAAPQPDKASASRFTLGGRTQEFNTDNGLEQRLTFDLCRQSGVVTGNAEILNTADLGGRGSGALVRSVHVEPC